MRTGLLLEGGAMRCMYTEGVIDVFLENEIKIDRIVGVSAGALLGINYKSKQVGRGLRYSKKFDNTIQDILNEKADLVLLDINLPYTDGEFVCKEVRKLSNVPIIMVTSRDNEIDELMSLNYGADQYVTKPYNIQILLAKITGLIKRNENSGRNSIYKRQWNRHKKRRNN